MTDPLRLLRTALDETIARFAADAGYRGALVALSTYLSKIAHGPGSEDDLLPSWNDLPWTFFHDGVDSIVLACPEDGVAAAALLRYRAGATVPDHLHTGDEHIIILSGSQWDERGVYGCGATIFNPAGSVHSVVSTDGCVVGIWWEKPVRFLAGGRPSPSRQDR